ncbi:MAG: type II toxin-antitoxin system Phd/YefM family antitoxin, partial [Terriglobales bacterium]
MANIIPALTARTQFGQILRRVKQNKERFVVDKRGEPQAVIMSVEEY